MTQEELDALMNSDVDTLDESSSDDTLKNLENDIEQEDFGSSYPPPPPTEDHKVVYQLDDVTRDSEVKAGELFDRLESMSDSVANIEVDISNITSLLNKNRDTFEKLSSKFENINTFKSSLDDTVKALDNINNLKNNLDVVNDDIMLAMDGMQFQDIHRQKIERVINIIRNLSNYMNSLLESRMDDSKRVSSAKHIAGDTDTEDLVGNDDIADLLEAFANKDT
jgi:chemotaxis regulatin CheY-phosphate phosphatase CheZ